ncbi:rough deal protein C-terminal region-domain-containing protein [Fimicolochytrium jonesii]|uniref:rough deal protein C-terminal region-domain-containing protein n=1 Tax=Fimicolochytrium jonesii TaxID=1396493 RepID=UPI0022FE85B2|nr:rough deal protein C-terminal region-domain-containing protein [Fimicolochytrium jonesii]KAI8821507.1 rough deal protein C-terminal region-domain-containing protein [Fimicolochytrium jonesii]
MLANYDTEDVEEEAQTDLIRRGQKQTSDSHADSGLVVHFVGKEGVDDDRLCEDVTQGFQSSRGKGTGLAKTTVHKVETLAWINAEESLRCTAIHGPDGLCVSVADTVFLIDAGCSEHRATIALDCLVERTAFSRDESFIVVADRLGTLRFVHLGTSSVVFSRDVFLGAVEDEGPPTFVWVGFVAAKGGVSGYIDRKGADQLLVVLRDMQLLRFSNIDTKGLDAAICANDLERAKELYEAITMERVDLNDGTGLTSVRDMVTVWDHKGAERLIVVGSGEQPLSVWQRSRVTQKTMKVDAVKLLLKGRTVVQAEADRSGRRLIMLDDSGRLSIWDSHGLFKLYHYDNTNLVDFVFHDSNAIDMPDSTIIALTNAKGGRVVQIIRLPSFTVMQELRVSEASWLFSREASAVDDGSGFRFVEALSNEDGSAKFYIRTLQETVPYHRFEQLLQSRRFEEAEVFALDFGLDVQYVLKAKLDQMARNVDLHALLESKGADHFAQTLMDELRSVEDEEFAIDYCLQITLPTFRSTYSILTFARVLINETTKGSDISTDKVLALHRAIRRIGTYQLISFERMNRYGGAFGHGAGAGWDPRLLRDADGFNAQEWQAMRTVDFVMEMREMLRSGDLRLAVAVWKRHYLDEELLPHIHDIVSDIPEHASLEDYVPWLKMDVLPIIQRTGDRHKLAIWIEHRARVVEAREKRPHGALEVVRLLDSVALPGMCDQVTDASKDPTTTARDHQLFTPATPAYYVENAILFAQTSGLSTFGSESSSGKVWANGLKQQLDDLVYLWDKHDLYISLNDYSRLSTSDIAKDLLDRVAAPELLGGAIEKHFRCYVERNNLAFDELLAEYCVDLMDGSIAAAAGSRAMADSSWQARVLCVLLYVVDVDVKADVVMELMKRTPVPWGSDVGEVFLATLKYPVMRRREELREQYRLLKLKRMLVSYGIGSFNISDKVLAKGLLPRILGRMDVMHAMDDVMQVVSAYHHISVLQAYRIRLRNLYEHGFIERANRLLQTGHEDPSTASGGPSDDGLELELDVRLDIVEQIGVAKEVATHFSKVLEDAAAHQQATDEAGEDAKRDFAWAIDASVALAELIVSMQEELANLQSTENVASATSGSVSSTAVGTHGARNALVLAAADPEICGYDDALRMLQHMKHLFTEFGVMMSLRAYSDELERRKILATFAKKVYRYVGNAEPEKAPVRARSSKGKGKAWNFDGEESPQPADDKSDSSQTALYRLAYVLGFERSKLRGILAEEAARNGDFKSSLVLCKELFDKSPNEETARTLQRVARLLTQYAASNKQVYRDAKAFKTHCRLTSRIVQLSAQAFCTCGEEDVEDALDDFKNFELQHTVFTQCDAGDYEALVASEFEAFRGGLFGAGEGSNVFGGSVGIGGSSASASSPSSASRDSSERRVKPQEVPARTEMELANIGDRFASSFFDENFREASLVLSTETAMDLVSSFVLDASAVKDQNAILGLQVGEDEQSAKGKKEAERGHPAHSGRLLAEYLVNNKSLQTVLRVLQRAKEAILRAGGPREASAWKSVIGFHTETLGRLLAAVMSTRKIDQRLAVGCLVSMPLKQAFEAYKAGMSTTGQEYARVLRIAGIGIAVAAAWKQRTFRISCEDLAANAKWWHQLRLLGIPFDKDTFRYRTETGGHQRRVVPQLLVRTGFDILTCLEFARSYDIEDDFVIMEYVKGLLLTTDEDSDYQSRVAGIVDDAVNKDRMLATLTKECLPRVSPYDYERLLFIATQILRVKPDAQLAKSCKEVVNVLFDYVRLKPPAFEELVEADRVITGSITTLELDAYDVLRKKYPKSSQRLPYHALTIDPWSVLGPEMTEESIPRLRPLRRMLDLELDKFYVVAIENLFDSRPPSTVGTSGKLSSGRSSPEADATWTANSPQLRFADVKRLLTHIADDAVAVETLLEVARRFPCGHDRISSYRMALMRTERMEAKEQQSADKIPEGVAKSEDKRSAQIRQVLIVTETEHQLRTLGMADMQQYISVQDSMTNLMHTLYWNKSEAALDPKNDLDLHGVVNDIAKRTGLNPNEFRTWLIGKWLSAEVPISDEEREMYLPSMRVQINNILNSREEIALQMRLLYLLRSLSVQSGTQYLLNFVSQPTSKILTLNRVRALSVLFQLASPKELAKDGYEDIKKYMQMLLYLADFEELRIAQSLREFEKCDKEAFVRSLWVNQKDELKIVQLICNICLDYHVYDLTLWESALHRLLDKKLYRYLLGMLEHLTSVPKLGQMRSLPKIWNGVLLGCLRLLTEDKESTPAMYDRVLTLLQKCPFLPEINLDAFVNHFDQLAMKTPATFSELLNALRGIAALPPTSNLFGAIKKCVSRLDHSELMQALDCISGRGEQSGIVPVQRIEYAATDTWIGKTWVIRAIYDQINESGAYELLLSTKHLAGFVSYLVDCDRIDHLLVASLKAQRTAAAIEIIRMYAGRYPQVLQGMWERRPDHDEEDESQALDVEAVPTADLLRVYINVHSFPGVDPATISAIRTRVQSSRR